MPETYYLLAVIEKEAGNFDQAAALLKNGVKLQPSNGMALSSTSGAFIELNTLGGLPVHAQPAFSRRTETEWWCRPGPRCRKRLIKFRAVAHYDHRALALSPTVIIDSPGVESRPCTLTLCCELIRLRSAAHHAFHLDGFKGMTRNREPEKEILSEIFRLIEEQTRALQSRLSAEEAAQCEERSYRIQNLLQQVSRDIPVLKNGA
jgi:hypothetical protein